MRFNIRYKLIDWLRYKFKQARCNHEFEIIRWSICPTFDDDIPYELQVELKCPLCGKLYRINRPISEMYKLENLVHRMFK